MMLTKMAISTGIAASPSAKQTWAVKLVDGKPQRHRALATRTPAVIERIGSGSTSGNNNRTIKIATVPLRRGGNAFSSLESIITSTFNSAQPGARLDWQEIAGCWVLAPPEGVETEAVVHFMGAAFVGAAPQLSYRLFLEALAYRGIIVVATPYSTGFDQLRACEEVHVKYVECMAQLHAAGLKEYLPVYGVGHSQGALLQTLFSSRFSVRRAGNVLLGFNAKPATTMVPFLSPVIAPGARLLAPLLARLAESPVSSTVAGAVEALKGMSPSLLRQVSPVLEQLAPMYLDVAQGRQEFTPSPDAARGMIKDSYRVPRNLLLRFKDDILDETAALNALFMEARGFSPDVDMRTLPGGHLRPLQQALVDLPPPVAKAANQAVAASGDLLERMADAASDAGAAPVEQQLHQLGKSIDNMAWALGGQVGGPVTDNVQGLADEVAAWMGVGNVVVKGGRALPADLVE